MDELPILQRLAEFYFLWSKQPEKFLLREDFPYVNQILRLANEGKVEPDNTYVVWARDRAARILAGSGDYQKSLLAQKVAQSNGRFERAVSCPTRYFSLKF